MWGIFLVGGAWCFWEGFRFLLCYLHSEQHTIISILQVDKIVASNFEYYNCNNRVRNRNFDIHFLILYISVFQLCLK